MGKHNEITGMEYTRDQVKEMEIRNFMSLGQLAAVYLCTEANVRQNIMKINRTTKKERVAKVDWVRLFPSDLSGKKPLENEKATPYIICNEKLDDLLLKRSVELGKDVQSPSRKDFKFINDPEGEE